MRTSGILMRTAKASAVRLKTPVTDRTPPPRLATVPRQAPRQAPPRFAPVAPAATSTGGRLGERLRRYLSCLRLQEILVLQGSPLLGAAFAIRHPAAENVGPLAMLTIANICLVAHIFMLNDWSGLTTDLTDPNKAASVFTARGVGRKEIGGLAASLLALSLLLFSRLGPSTLWLSLAIATLSALYSLPHFNWKGRPLLNSAAHLVGGALHFLLGYSLGNAIDRRGLAIATFFALTFAAGHLTQEVRDHQGDVLNAIRTNAVIFGHRRTFAASLALFTLAHALLLLLALQGILPHPLAALVALYPVHLRWSLKTLAEGLTYASIRRLQARYRALYAIIGLAMVAALWLD
jgi:4-hydroxybenzoate polyprenyltransferase